jgi:hypothetical protein
MNQCTKKILGTKHETIYRRTVLTSEPPHLVFYEYSDSLTGIVLLMESELAWNRALTETVHSLEQ